MTCFNKLSNLDSQSKCINTECPFNSNCMSKNCAIVQLLDSESERLTLGDISQMFDLSRMRICQIEKKAISKLRPTVT